MRDFFVLLTVTSAVSFSAYAGDCNKPEIKGCDGAGLAKSQFIADNAHYDFIGAKLADCGPGKIKAGGKKLDAELGQMWEVQGRKQSPRNDKPIDGFLVWIGPAPACKATSSGYFSVAGNDAKGPLNAKPAVLVMEKKGEGAIGEKPDSRTAPPIQMTQDPTKANEGAH